MPEPRVTRVEPLAPRGARVRVHLDEGPPLEVALEALELGRLGVGDTLTTAARDRLLGLDADVEVREAALGLLSHRARTRQELKTKLRRRGYDAERVDACLARLQEKGLLDDAVVAAAFVRDRLAHRPRGSNRLVAELRAKGVAPEVAQETIALVFEDERVSDVDLARGAANAWLSRQPVPVREALGSRAHTPASGKAKRRLYGYLVRRGFRGDAVSEAMLHAEAVARAGTS